MAQETERFYRDLVTRHLNLIREWERLNTSEGRVRITQDLDALQESVDSLIDQFNTNNESNTETFNLSLALDQRLFNGKSFRN